MAKAQVSLGLDEVDMTQWADEWLTSAGCNEICLEYTVVDGKVATA